VRLSAWAGLAGVLLALAFWIWTMPTYARCMEGRWFSITGKVHCELEVWRRALR
jgi:hypothetical protein